MKQLIGVGELRQELEQNSRQLQTWEGQGDLIEKLLDAKAQAYAQEMKMLILNEQNKKCAVHRQEILDMKVRMLQRKRRTDIIPDRANCPRHINALAHSYLNDVRKKESACT